MIVLTGRAIRVGIAMIGALVWIGVFFGVGFWATIAQWRFIALYRTARGRPTQPDLDAYIDHLVTWDRRGWPNALSWLRHQPEPAVEAARRLALRRTIVWLACIVVAMPLPFLLAAL